MATVNIYDMADTWNDGGAGTTTFTAIKMDVTDTSSASSSLLMDLLVDSSTVFSISAAGNISLGADVAAPGSRTLSMPSVTGVADTAGANLTIQGSQSTGSAAGGSILFQVSPAGSAGSGQNGLEEYISIKATKGGTAATGNLATLAFSYDDYLGGQTGFGVPYSGQLFSYMQGIPSSRLLSGQLELPPTSFFGFNSQADYLGNSDVRLYRDAANTLALRNGTNAQEFRVYKTETGTVYKALLGDNNLMKISGEAFTDGAGANTATLTNAPAAGNPTKWIPIDDNGTTRYIPAW